MLTFSQMLVHFVAALILGGLMGLEREFLGKEAGIRTCMLVAGGASLFTIISLIMPSVLGVDVDKLGILSDRVVSNIVVGVGFLGAGVVIKTNEHVRGLTTAAVIWATAAVGTLAGLGLIKFAATVAVIMSGMLFFLKHVGLYEKIRPEHRHKKELND